MQTHAAMTQREANLGDLGVQTTACQKVCVGVLVGGLVHGVGFCNLQAHVKIQSVMHDCTSVISMAQICD